MATILSSISGQFGKQLILGAFLPVTLFVIIGLICLTPFFPSAVPGLHSLETLDPQWQVAVVTLVIIVLSSLLYNLNTSIIRIYEGYPWRDTWFGRWRTHHYDAQLDSATARWTGMRTLLRAMDGVVARARGSNAADAAAAATAITNAVAAWTGMGELRGTLSQAQEPAPDPPPNVLGLDLARWNTVHARIARARSRIGMRIYGSFPASGFVMPTRLGNVIRCFESYSLRMYGIESITLWPRLIAKIDATYASSIDDAKTPFDFMLNSSVLSAVLAFLLLLAGLLDPTPLTSGTAVVVWLVQVGTLAVLGIAFYAWSIPRAAAWGEVVKGAFDLYRWQLLAQLGYTNTPTTAAAEQALWDDISQHMIAPDVSIGPKPGYAASPAPPLPPTAARGAQANRPVSLQITRAVQRVAWRRGTMTVVLRVRNHTTAPVSGVVVTDTLPSGYDYEWNTASIGQARVSGTNPYQFQLGNLAVNQEAGLTYRAVSRRSVS